MDQALLILKQTLTMAIYMAVGYILYRRGLITKEGSRTMANILVWGVKPAVLIKSFLVEYSPEKLSKFGVSVLLGVGVLTFSIIVARIIYKDKPVEQFAAAYSNAGFMGIPLVTSILGDEAVFYLIGLIAYINLTQWSYGATLLKGEKVKVGWKKIVLNPMLFSVVIGLFLFITGLGLKLPSPVTGAVKGIAGMNSPLAMLVLGVYLAQADIKKMFLSKNLYTLSLVRLVVIPLLTILVMWKLPVDNVIKLTIFITTAAPVGTNIAVYSQLYDADYPYACQTVALSTVLSIFILPITTMAAGLLFAV